MRHTGRILLVDDDAAIRQFLCVVLVQAGYEVLAAKGSNEALRALLMRALVGTGAIAHGVLISGDPGAVNLDLMEQQVGVRVRLLKKPLLPAELLRMVTKLLSPKLAAGGAAPTV